MAQFANYNDNGNHAFFPIIILVAMTSAASSSSIDSTSVWQS